MEMKKSKGTKGLKGIWKNRRAKVKTEFDSTKEHIEAKPSTSVFGREALPSTSKASTSIELSVPGYLETVKPYDYWEHLQPKVSLGPSLIQPSFQHPHQKYQYHDDLYGSSYPPCVQQNLAANKHLPSISSDTKIKSLHKKTSSKKDHNTKKEVYTRKIKPKEIKGEQSRKVLSKSKVALDLSILRCTIAERLSIKSQATKIPRESLTASNLLSPSELSRGINEKDASQISDHNFLSPLKKIRLSFVKSDAESERRVCYSYDDKERINKKEERINISNTSENYVNQDSDKEMDVTLRAEKNAKVSIKKKVKKKLKVHTLSTSFRSLKKFNERLTNINVKGGRCPETSSEESPKSKSYVGIGVDHVALRKRLETLDPTSDRELTIKSPSLPPTPRTLSQPNSPSHYILQPRSNKSYLEENIRITDEEFDFTKPPLTPGRFRSEDSLSPVYTLFRQQPRQEETTEHIEEKDNREKTRRFTRRRSKSHKKEKKESSRYYFHPVSPVSSPSSSIACISQETIQGPLLYEVGTSNSPPYYGYYPSYVLTYSNHSPNHSVSSNSSQFPRSSSSSNRQSPAFFSNSPSPVQTVSSMPSFETFNPLGTSTPRLTITDPNSFLNKTYLPNPPALCISRPLNTSPPSSRSNFYPSSSPLQSSTSLSPPLESPSSSTLCSVSPSRTSSSIPYSAKPSSSKSPSISQCLSIIPSCSLSSPLPQGFYFINPSFTLPYLSGVPLRPPSVHDTRGHNLQVGQYFNREYFYPDLNSRQMYTPTSTESGITTSIPYGVSTLHSSSSTDQQYYRNPSSLSNPQPRFQLPPECWKPSSSAEDKGHSYSQHSSDQLRILPYSSDAHIPSSSSDSRLPSLGIISPQSPIRSYVQRRHDRHTDLLPEVHHLDEPPLTNCGFSQERDRSNDK